MGSSSHAAGDTLYGGYEGRSEGRYEGRAEGRYEDTGGMNLSYEERERETLPTRHTDVKSDGTQSQSQPQQRFGQLEQRLEDTMEEVAR